MHADFAPRWPWRLPHLQSILPRILPRRALQRRAAPLRAASRELILDCGDGVRLQAWVARPSAPPAGSAILLHGWEGSADAGYVLSLAARLFASGVEVARLNLRDHGDTHHLNEGIFHSCRLPEVIGAVAALAPEMAAPPALVGFSLGGNFMLRVATSSDPRVPPLAKVVAICPVLDPASAMRAMEQGWQVYQKYFVRKWRRSLLRKRALWPTTSVDGEFLQLADLRSMTAAMVAQHTDFEDIGAYLKGYAITGERLAGLKVPATILAALDDPIIPSSDLARVARSPQLKIVATAHGGHTGYMLTPWSESWVNGFVLRELGFG